MSELTTGGINFGYQSPISQIYKDVEYKFKEDMENKTMEAIHHLGISVDKEELIKALQYDRNQYDKGYSDGRASIVEEFENLKAEIKEEEEKGIYYECEEWIEGRPCDEDYFYGLLRAIMIIDNHIAEMKGNNESKETETWNGYHGQITAPKGTFKKIYEDTNKGGKHGNS